jgi:hypothetical protein
VSPGPEYGAALSPDCAAVHGTSAAPVAGVPGTPVLPLHDRSPCGGTGPKTAPSVAKLAAAMSEGELDRGVRHIASDLGVLVYHTFDSRRSEPGFPDLVLVGSRGVMYRELKRETGKLTAAQKTWLAALRKAGQDAGTWRPSALLSGDVARELAALAGIGAR